MGIFDKLQKKKNICNMSETAKNMVEACKYPYQYFHKNNSEILYSGYTQLDVIHSFH